MSRGLGDVYKRQLQKQQMNKETSLEQIYMSLIGEGEHYAGVQKTVMCE